MALLNTFHALLFLLCFGTISAIPTSSLTTRQMSGMASGGSKYTCAAESYTDLDFMDILGDIWTFCREYEGHLFRADGTVQMVDDTLRKNTYSISTPQSGGHYPECDYTLDLTRCVYWLTEAIQSCNHESNTTIIQSGLLIDRKCEWDWEVQLIPELTPEKRQQDGPVDPDQVNGYSGNVDKRQQDGPVDPKEVNDYSGNTGKRQDDGSPFTCPSWLAYNSTFEEVLNGIWDFCTPLNGTEVSQHVASQTFTNTSSKGITYTIVKPEGGPYSSCNYTLSTDRCVYQLTTAMTSCNDFSNTTISNSGVLTDNECHWTWKTELKPILPGRHHKRQQDGPVNSSEVNGYSGGSDLALPAKRQGQGDPGTYESHCYNNGYEWDPADLTYVLDAFCHWADGYNLVAGGELQYTYTLHGHDQISPLEQLVTFFDVWSNCGGPITYDSCNQAMSPLVKNCPNRGGWAEDDCGTWKLDGDPKRHGDQVKIALESTGESIA